MPVKSLKVKPNKFYVETQVTNGQMVFDEHGDFSNATDYHYDITTGKTPNSLVLSGSVDTTEHVDRGRYNLAGGFLRTYVSGVSVVDGDATVPTMQLYALHNDYDITEGGMKFARKTAAGTITATNGSATIAGSSTDFDGADGFFGDFFNGGNYQGGAFVWIGPVGSREKYEVASIASDTSLTLTSNYTGTTTSTTQLQLDDSIGANLTSFLSTYTGPNINMEENFDGLDAQLSTVTEFVREGANAVVKRGHPYIECSYYDVFKIKVKAEASFQHMGPIGVNSVKRVMEQNCYYPFPAKNAYDLSTPDGYATAMGEGVAARYTPSDPNRYAKSDGQYLEVPGFSNGRLYLAKYASYKNGGGFYSILNRQGKSCGYGISLSALDLAIVGYDSTQTFNPDPENTVNTTKNNTIFDKIYSTMTFNNPFTASTEVPIVSSTVELQSDVVNSGANAVRLYHLWDFSPDNVDIEKYFGRENSLNPQTAYMAKYNLPYPIIQDMSLNRLGDRRTYMPYVSLDMNIAKLQPNVLYDIQNYLGTTKPTASGNLVNDPQNTTTGASYFTSARFGDTSAIRTKARTLLRSVVVTFSNYKPLDTHTTLEEFLKYGCDNAYGSAQNDESIVGGVVFSRLGMDGADIDNDFIYAEALPIVKDSTTMDYAEQFAGDTGKTNKGFGLVTIQSGSGDGKLQQMLMKAANINNTYSASNQNTPRVVKLPMNQFFNMKFYVDASATQGSNISSRNPYSGFPTSVQGVGMRCVFETDTINEDSDSEDLYTDMPFLDLNFSVSGGNTTGGGSGDASGGDTPSFSFSDRFVTTHNITPKYPKHMIVWVQNYRFVNSSEPQFAFGDNGIINTASGSAIEAEVYVDNFQAVDFYKNLASTTAKGQMPAPLQFPQGENVDSPITFIESSTYDITSFNTGVAQSATAANTTIRSYSPASYFSVGFDSKLDLPISGSSTARRGYLLLSDFYTTSFSQLENIVPDLYSGATISLSDGDYDGGLRNNRLGVEMSGSVYASGTVGTDYYDPAVGNNQYAVTGGKDVTTKVCVGTGSNNNFLSTDGFTQKGFVNINISNAGNATSDAYANWGKRENILCSTKVTDVARGGNDLNSNQLQIADPTVLNPYNKDEQYILFIVGFPVTTAYYKILTLRDGVSSVDENNVVTFNESVVSGSTTQPIGQETMLPNLYLSPYKYWINLNTKGDQDYKPRTYTGVTLVNNNMSGTSASPSSITGTTYNEAVYTWKNSNTGSIGLSAPYENAWQFLFDPESDTAMVLNQDFGYGAYNVETKTGGYLSYCTPAVDTYNYMDIGSLLVDRSVQEMGNYNLLLRQIPSTYPTQVKLIGDEYSSTNADQFKPTYIYEYIDDTPFVNNFSVEPAFNILEDKTSLYELGTENLNAVKFKWDMEDDDIWYQMIFIDKDGTIENKYQNAKLWVPCNEEPTTLTTKPTINWYNQIANTSGTATVGANVRSFIDGVQGYSPKISGNSLGTKSIRIPSGSNNAFKELTEYTMSVHVTFDSSEKGSNTIVLGQGVFNHLIALRKNSSDVIEFQHSNGTQSSTATGSTVIRCDGKTVYSIIVTYKYESEAGPDLQLFVDGTLDGYVTDAVSQYNVNADLDLGYYTATLPGGTNYFQGRIEEFVLWDKQYIVANGNEYIYNTADLDDLTSSSINTWSAKLFVFDYHNIRGKTYREVGSSKNISWRTTPV